MSHTLGYYQHRPLNTDIDEIRLVTILPGQDGSEICIVIDNCQLSKNHRPSYEALSYAWGSTDTMASLYVGGCSPQLLSVPPNLAACLPYLRLPTGPRTLWVDAICINQKNLEERKQQVQKMASIFKMAKRVVVWLGLEENDSTLALRTLDSLATKIDVDWHTWVMKSSSPKESKLHWGDLDQKLPYQKHIKDALKPLFDRPWFERLWVQQEIRLASDAIVMCGTYTIPWSSLRSAVFCMWVKSWKCGYIVDKDHLELAYNLAKTSYVDMVMLFDNTEKCKCKDDRDRVYALLPSLRDEDQIGIEADYNETVAQVYKETVQRYIECRKRLDILTRCNLSTKHTETPSWVPNFAMPRGSKPLIELNADGRSPCSAQILGKILKAKGVIGATVNHAETIHSHSNDQEFVVEARRLAPANTGNESYIGGGTTLEAFDSALNVGELSSHWMPVAEAFQDFGVSVEHLQHIFDPLKEPFQPLVPVLWRYIR